MIELAERAVTVPKLTVFDGKPIVFGYTLTVESFLPTVIISGRPSLFMSATLITVLEATVTSCFAIKDIELFVELFINMDNVVEPFETKISNNPSLLISPKYTSLGLVVVENVEVVEKLDNVKSPAEELFLYT
jgi:hypothetical protein